MRIVFIMLIACFVSFPLFAQLDQVTVKSNERVSAVTFKAGTAELEKSSEAMLEKLRSYLLRNPRVTLMRIEAHVTGTDNNQALSELRAVIVVKWLISQGIACQRLLQ